MSSLRKFGFLVVLLLVTFVFALPSTAVLSNNMPSSAISNGGFEDGTLEPLWAPVRVSPYGIGKLSPTVASRHMNVTQECVHTGSYALKIFNLTQDNETLPYFGTIFHVPMDWLNSNNILGYQLSFWVSTGDFNDTTMLNPQVLQWELGVGVYCIDENDRIVFYTLWNPSYPTINASNPDFWCDEWRNVMVNVPGDTAAIIIGVDWKAADLVPSNATIYFDDVDLEPYSAFVDLDGSTYYVGNINLIASVSNYEESSFRISVDTSISKKYMPLTPGEFTSSIRKLTVGLQMSEVAPGAYSGFWPVPMRWTLIGPYDATFTFKASFTGWPDGITYDYILVFSRTFTVIPLTPIILSTILIGVIVAAILKSKWMSVEIPILLILLLILLLY